MLWRVAAYSGPGFPRPATNRIGFSSTVAKSKIENGLLLLFFFLGSFFLRSRCCGGFALFLLLGDNFRSGSGFGRGNGWRFFHYGSEDRKRGEIRLHFCRDSRRKLNVTNVNGI